LNKIFAMTIKQQLTLEIEKASPEMLVQLFEFVQSLKKSRLKTAELKQEGHFLDDLRGSISPEDGEELDAIVSREFQQIEGEW
jgi:hypothetical protein